MEIYLIIGLTKETRHWSDDFLNELKGVLAPSAIHLVELPGAGKLISSKSPLSISGIVDEVRASQIFHPDKKRVVIAISLGGMVAWDWVTRYPADFHHFVMINSSLAGISPTFKRLRPKALWEFIRIAASLKITAREKRILDLCSNHLDRRKKILPKWIEIGQDANMIFMNVIRQLMAAMKFRARKIPALPMLVIAAKYDRLAHYSCSTDIAKFTNAKLIISSDASIGHAFHVDGPEFLVKAIKEWLMEKELKTSR